MNEYKGYRLLVDMDEEGITCPELELSATTISEMKRLINARLKERSQTKSLDVSALYPFHDGGYKRVKITSVTPRGEVWINDDGRRTKENSVRGLVADTPENEAALKEIQRKIKAVQEEESALIDSIKALPRPILEPAP